ncbi:ABC transporter permease [Geojedonia litorea]|uniref:ABC transporter permease n=1 Tax=Geojedonia litorea TaxID=1268269 RepID=A0ABV9N3C1_9FLAO
MLTHYFKIALRNLKRQKVLSLINILGLSIGLACFSLFLLYSVNEFSFDRFHKNADTVYRVYRWTESMNGENAQGDIYMPSPLGPALKMDIPDVKEFVRFREDWGDEFVKIDNQVSKCPLAYTDPSFFTVFTFPLKYGNPKTALNDLQNVVITQKKAKELFGMENVVGRTIEIKIDQEFVPFTISAVAEDIPANSSIVFELLGNFSFMETTNNGKRGVNNWNRSGYITYVELNDGSGLPNDIQKLASFRHKYYPEEEKRLKAAGYTWEANTPPIRFGMQPLKEGHTSTIIQGGTVDQVNPKSIWILLSIAAGVLLIACINFTTLAIGRSARRSKEVGLRKVIGGQRKQLILQFLSESIILSVVSAIIGFLLAKLMLPYFNSLSGRELSFSFSSYPEMVWMLIGLVLLVGLLAGSYPALILSSFNPVEALKSKIKINGSNLFTKSLVTVQFALSVGLIICTMIILKQTKYMSSKHPGFNKENIVVVDADGTNSNEIYPLFKQALLARADISMVAGAELGLGEGTGWSLSGFEYKGNPKSVFEYYVDADYIPLMEMQLIDGRNFDPTIASDTINSVIVNEAMVKDFGWTLDNAVGQVLTGYHRNLGPDKSPTVIGVIKDFNFRPFKEEVKPQMFHQFADYAPYKYFVKIQPGNPTPALEAMQREWQILAGNLPFNYNFLDENLNNFYRAERRLSSIIGWAGGISVFLACLGLFGLVALAAVNRTKEIGIRKVLGASVANIVGLLSKDFIKLVVIALFIAAPLAFYFMDKWLQDFAYRISIGWWVFIISGVLAITIAFITIGFQAVKAGISNPVNSLRTE